MEGKHEIFEHSVDGSTTLPVLKSLLPDSIPIYRRIQSSRRTLQSHIFATFLPETEVDLIPLNFAIAFVDRSTRPETELFLYLSSQDPELPNDQAQSRAIILALLSKLATLPVITNILEPSTTASKYGAHLSNTKLILAGAVGEETAKIVDSYGLLDPLLPNLNTPYLKFIFHEKHLPTPSRPSLPDGLRWGQLTEQHHYELVISRTEIPRQIKTLASAVSVAVFDILSGQPVAWAFLSVGGSMSSLHVEEAWRRKGIARLLAAEIVRKGMGEDGYGHADVGVDNVASRRVCESIGGQALGKVYWLRIDLGKV